MRTYEGGSRLQGRKRALTGTSPFRTPTTDLQPPELGENYFLLFRHPVRGILLRQSELTKAPILVLSFLVGLFINPLEFGLGDEFIATQTCKWPHY